MESLRLLAWFQILITIETDGQQLSTIENDGQQLKMIVNN